MTLKYGSIREDGYIYLGKNSKGKDHFISPNAFEKRKLARAEYLKTYSKEYYDKNKDSINKRAQDWRKENKDALKKHYQDWISKPSNRLKNSLYNAKQRAKKKNILFNIGIEDLLPIPSNCPVFGTKFNFCGDTGFVNDSPSIDRIDPSKGYIKGNVRLISWRANRLKSDASIEELKLVISYMESERNEIN